MFPPRIICSCSLGNFRTRTLKISRRQSTSGSSEPKMIFSGPSSLTRQGYQLTRLAGPVGFCYFPGAPSRWSNETAIG
jgi:hypothetical protein